MKTHALVQLSVITWMCSSGRSQMAALPLRLRGLLRMLLMLSLDWPERPATIL